MTQQWRSDILNKGWRKGVMYAAGCRLPIVLSALPWGACWSFVCVCSFVCNSPCCFTFGSVYVCVCPYKLLFLLVWCVWAPKSLTEWQVCVCLCDEMRLDFLQGCSSMEATWSSRNDRNVGTVVRFALSVTTTTSLLHGLEETMSTLCICSRDM